VLVLEHIQKAVGIGLILAASGTLILVVVVGSVFSFGMIRNEITGYQLAAQLNAVPRPEGLNVVHSDVQVGHGSGDPSCRFLYVVVLEDSRKLFSWSASEGVDAYLESIETMQWKPIIDVPDDTKPGSNLFPSVKTYRAGPMIVLVLDGGAQPFRLDPRCSF